MVCPVEREWNHEARDDEEHLDAKPPLTAREAQPCRRVRLRIAVGHVKPNDG